MRNEKLDFNEWWGRITVEITRYINDYDTGGKEFVQSRYLVRRKGDQYDEFEIRFNSDGKFLVTNLYLDDFTMLADTFEELCGIMSLNPEEEIYAVER